MTPAHPMQHRRVRNIKSALYWSAVFTMLAGGAITKLPLLLYAAGLCPLFCYRTARCDVDDNIESQKMASKIGGGCASGMIVAAFVHRPTRRHRPMERREPIRHRCTKKNSLVIIVVGRCPVTVKDGTRNNRDEENVPCNVVGDCVGTAVSDCVGTLVGAVVGSGFAAFVGACVGVVAGALLALVVKQW